jgi:hypothetical protein
LRSPKRSRLITRRGELFTSEDDFVTATLHLKAQRALEDDTEDE